MPDSQYSSSLTLRTYLNRSVKIGTYVFFGRFRRLGCNSLNGGKGAVYVFIGEYGAELCAYGHDFHETDAVLGDCFQYRVVQPRHVQALFGQAHRYRREASDAFQIFLIFKRHDALLFNLMAYDEERFVQAARKIQEHAFFIFCDARHFSQHGGEVGGILENELHQIGAHGDVTHLFQKSRTVGYGLRRFPNPVQSHGDGTFGDLLQQNFLHFRFYPPCDLRIVGEPLRHRFSDKRRFMNDLLNYLAYGTHIVIIVTNWYNSVNIPQKLQLTPVFPYHYRLSHNLING